MTDANFSLDSTDGCPSLQAKPAPAFSTSEHGIEEVDEWAMAEIPLEGSRKKSMQLSKLLEGDQLRVHWERRRKKIYLRFFERLADSPQRQASVCPHFERCGGCQWQHLDAQKLLLRKADLVLKTLHSVIEPGVSRIHAPLISPEIWRYRNKMEYSFGKSQGRFTLGLHRTRHDVIDIHSCPIAPSWFERALESVRSWWLASALEPFHPASDQGSLRQLTLRKALKGQGRIAVLTVSGNPNYALTKQQIEGFKQAILQSVEEESERAFTTIFVTLQQCIPSQPTRFFEMHLHGPDAMKERLSIQQLDEMGTLQAQEFEFSISPTTFFQPNTLGAELLINQAMRLLGSKPLELVWDLFCGSGTLSIIASRFAKRVIGVEVNPMAVLDAEGNRALNRCQNVEFVCCDLHKSPKESLDKLLEKGSPEVIIVDPPRAGILEAGARLLGQIKAPRVLYISCNPISQARDIAYLKEYGYRLSDLAVVDQFPQTGHVETIGLLTYEKDL